MAQNANADIKIHGLLTQLKFVIIETNAYTIFIQISAHPPWKPEKIISVSFVTNKK